MLREQDRLLVFSLLLPLLDGDRLRTCCLELISLGQRLDAPRVMVDAWLRALPGGVLPPEALEEIGRHLVDRGDDDELRRLVEQTTRGAMERVAAERAPLLMGLAGRVEGMGDPAAAVRLWLETWRCQGAPVGEQSQAAANLKRLHRERGDWSGYCGVLVREVMLARDVPAQVDALRELATVQSRTLGDLGAASRTVRRILQLDPDLRSRSWMRALLESLQEGEEDEARSGAATRGEGASPEQVIRRRVRRAWRDHEVPGALLWLRSLDPSVEENRRLVGGLVWEPSADDAALEEALRRGGLLLLRFLPRGAEQVEKVMDLARRLERVGRGHEAAACYRRVVADSPGHQEAQGRLDALQERSRVGDLTDEELARAATELVATQPRRAAQMFEQAAQLAAARDGFDDDAVRDYLGRAVKLGLALPAADLWALTSLEETLRQAGLYPELARLLEALAVAEGDAAERKHILCELGRIHLEAGHHPERAAEALQQALMLDPADDSMAQRLHDLHGTLKDQRSRARNLESLLAHTSGKERVPLTEELGAIYSEHLSEDQAAAMHYEELLSHVPDHPRALPFCRAIYERAGDYVSVVRILGEAARISTDRQTRATLHADAARVAMQRLTDLDLAIGHWQDAIRARPEDRDQFEGLRQVLETGGRWEELRQALLSGVTRTISAAEKVPLYMELARVARKQDDDPAAVGYLLSALQLSPGDGELLTRLESIYERLGQWRLLGITLRRHANHEQKPQEQRKHLLRAARVLLIRLGRDDEALAICDQIIQAHPGDREAATLMGEILGKRGQWEEKIALLRGQIEREDDPQELGRLHLELGRVLLDRMDDVEKASVHFEVALSLSGSSQGDVLALLRRIYDARDRLDLLVDLLQRRANMKSLSPERKATALCEMARIKAEHMGEQAQAQAAFEHALELDPRCLAALSALREQAASCKQWWEALEYTHRELKLEGDAERRASLLVELGSIQYEHLDEFQQAREALTEALEHDSNDHRALSLLGRIHFDCQEWEEASRVTGRLVELVRDQDDLHEHLYRLAYSLEKLGREEEAFRLFIRSFTREPMYLPTLDRMVDLCFLHRQWDNTLRIAETILQSYSSTKSVETRAELHLRIALCELYLGQRDAGTEFLQQLVLGSGEMTVASPRAWSEVAEPWASSALEPLLLHCMREELLERVTEATRRCLQLVPDHSVALQVFAAVKLSQQNWSEGLRALEQAARSEETSARLGAALLVCAGEVASRRLGASDRARSYFLWALSLDPAAESIHGRLKRLDKVEEEQPILLTRPKRRSVRSSFIPGAPQLHPRASEAGEDRRAGTGAPAPEERPIRKRDTQPFRSGLFNKEEKGE